MTSEAQPGTHVVLGTGQVGRPVASHLLDCGATVRVVNRSGTCPDGLEGADAVAADVTAASEARGACAGASVVYCCLQPPYDEWPAKFPPLIEGALAGAAAADARFVLADNCYMYGPVDGPIHEECPPDATTAKGRTRARVAETVLDAHRDGRVDATIGRASDFYGPGVRGSIVGERFFPTVLSGGRILFPGDADQPHTYTYVRDFARALVVLGADERALGEVWHVPGETLTTREFATVAGDVAGTDPSVWSMPSWVTGALGLFVPELRELREIDYQVREPFVVSHEKFAETFEFEPTSLREAIAATLEWYRTAD